jgi:hypothetical protein
VNKPELIRTIREAHQRVAGAIEHVPDERLLEPATNPWTGKDLFVHMAWWHDHSVRLIEALRAGRQPYDATDPTKSTDALNERTHREPDLGGGLLGSPPPGVFPSRRIRPPRRKDRRRAPNG